LLRRLQAAFEFQAADYWRPGQLAEPNPGDLEIPEFDASQRAG
jgi:hypothetical protein